MGRVSDMMIENDQNIGTLIEACRDEIDATILKYNKMVLPLDSNTYLFAQLHIRALDGSRDEIIELISARTSGSKRPTHQEGGGE